MGVPAMLRHLLIASLLLAGSDLCLGDERPHDEQPMISLKSIVVLPKALQGNLKAAQLSFGTERDAVRTATFGDERSGRNDDSFDWGFIGSGIGFNKRF